jgi:hypothetical protein
MKEHERMEKDKSPFRNLGCPPVERLKGLDMLESQLFLQEGLRGLVGRARVLDEALRVGR